MGSETRSRDNVANKILKIALKILYQLLIIVCIVLILVIVFQKVSDNNKSIAGYRLFRVITGSMEPEYDVGEVVISKAVKPQDIKVGDDIVYLGKYGEYNGKIIMHKVISIDKDEHGNFNFHAQGLHSSSVEDPEISSGQIYGVVKFKSGILTVLYKLATSIYSSFIIISILVLNVFVSFKFSSKTKATIQQLQEINEGEESEEVEFVGDNEEIEDIEDVEDSGELEEDNDEIQDE